MLRLQFTQSQRDGTTRRAYGRRHTADQAHQQREDDSDGEQRRRHFETRRRDARRSACSWCRW